MRVFRQHYHNRGGSLRESAKWYCEVADHNGRPQRFPGFTDRAATQELGNKLERLAACRALRESPDPTLAKWIDGLPPKLRSRLARVGLLDDRRLAATRPLGELVSDFESTLLARGGTVKHARQTSKRIARLFELCGFHAWTDLDPLRVERTLRELRERGDTKAQTTRGPIGMRTSNYTLRDARSFCRWMVNNGLASEDPLRVLRPMNANVERGRVRRAFTADELRALLVSTEAQPERWGMSGRVRALAYRLAVESGLRAAELASLTAASFSFDAESSTVTLQAAYSKHRREDVLPLRSDTAQALASFLRDLPGNARAFPIPKRSAEMLRADLAAAGLPFEDEEGRRGDFHALRHTFITNLARGGVSPKVAQALARHSTITLTLDRYTHLRPGDELRALDALPNLSTPSVAALRATGTDGAPVLPAGLPEVPRSHAIPSDSDSHAQHRKAAQATTQEGAAPILSPLRMPVPPLPHVLRRHERIG